MDEFWTRFEAAGFEVSITRTGETPHVQMALPALLIQCWPRKNGGYTWHWFGKTHRDLTPEQVFDMWEAGELEMPLEYDQIVCSFCGEDIWLAPQKKNPDKKYAINLDGSNHRYGCRRTQW